jgi:hypothetical protein
VVPPQRAPTGRALVARRLQDKKSPAEAGLKVSCKKRDEEGPHSAEVYWESRLDALSTRPPTHGIGDAHAGKLDRMPAGKHPIALCSRQSSPHEVDHFAAIEKPCAIRLDAAVQRGASSSSARR